MTDTTRRYVVRACDNDDSLGEPGTPGAPPRQRTWTVFDKDIGDQVAEYDTRARARSEASRLNEGVRHG
jgi:hypothetical protein